MRIAREKRRRVETNYITNDKIIVKKTQRNFLLRLRTNSRLESGLKDAKGQQICLEIGALGRHSIQSWEPLCQERFSLIGSA